MPKHATAKSTLDQIIEETEDHLKTETVGTPDYYKLVDSLAILYKLKDGHKPSKLELRDWMPIIGSLGSILIIVIFESFGHTVTSKAVGFVQKLKS